MLNSKNFCYNFSLNFQFYSKFKTTLSLLLYITNNSRLLKGHFPKGTPKRQVWNDGVRTGNAASCFCWLQNRSAVNHRLRSYLPLKSPTGERFLRQLFVYVTHVSIPRWNIFIDEVIRGCFAEKLAWDINMWRWIGEIKNKGLFIWSTKVG